MEIIWYGTAAIALRTKESSILFDPFVPLRGSRVPIALSDYDGYEQILVTHGHFDHIYYLPEIQRRNPSVHIHCTQTPYRTLRKKGIPAENLTCIAPSETMQIGDFRIRTYQSRHAVLEGLNVGVLCNPRLYRYGYNLPFILREHSRCRENQEILFFDIEAEGKKIFLLGSMNLDEQTVYPTGCDLLILPYTGYRDNLAQADKLIERLRPRAILPDHWDDTFPPVTSEVDVSDMERKYEGRIGIIRPGYKEPIHIA